MPMYEYRCQECGDEFELLIRSGDAPRCPSCSGQNLERLLSMFAVNSAERSQAALNKARRHYQQSKDRTEKVQHERQEIREHLQDDYGIDLSRKDPAKATGSS